MEVFAITDIFGRTPALETLCTELSPAVSDIHIIDPYQGADPGFKTEAQAYRCFMDRVGLETYQTILTDHLASSGPDTVLIGFSVGASAIWAISGRPMPRNIKKAFCFYGSQIRLHTPVEPLFDMELIFPEQEPHFDVDELIRTLSAKNRVVCATAPGLHGFMNELSPHFDPVCYTGYIRHLTAGLSRLIHRNV